MESPKGLLEPRSSDPVRHADPQISRQREGAAVEQTVVEYAERHAVVELPRARIPEPVNVGRFHGDGRVGNPYPVSAHRTTLTVDRENRWSEARMSSPARRLVRASYIGKFLPQSGTRPTNPLADAYCFKNVVAVGLRKMRVDNRVGDGNGQARIRSKRTVVSSVQPAVDVVLNEARLGRVTTRCFVDQLGPVNLPDAVFPHAPERVLRVNGLAVRTEPGEQGRQLHIHGLERCQSRCAAQATANRPQCE